MEALLQQLVPGYEQQVKGATEEQINRIEEIAGCSLPRFYRWFLLRMGADMGPFTYPPIDFTAATVIDCYERGLFSQDPSCLLIGFDSRDIPNHHYYHLGAQKNDDMFVASGTDTDNLWNQFETFREMLACDNLKKFKLWKLPQLCKGFFEDSGGDVVTQLKPVMESFGFKSPIPTGNICGLYDREDAALITNGFPKIGPKFDMLSFTLAGRDEKFIRSLLGQIATTSFLTIDVRKWEPPLKS